MGKGHEQTMNTLQEIALKELGETKKVRLRSLEEMRSWLKSNTSIKCSSILRLDKASCNSDKFLLRFLRAQKFDVKKATKMLERYLKLRAENPQWFSKLDQNADEDIHVLLRKGFMTLLPHTDEEGRLVVLNWAAVFDPHHYTRTDQMRCIMITLDILASLEEVQIRGLTYIIYGPGLSLAHASMWTPSEAAKIVTSCEKCIPVRHRKIVLVKLPLCLWALLEFAKHFLSAKMRNRIRQVSTFEDFPAFTFPKELDSSSNWTLEENGHNWIARIYETSVEMDEIASLQIDVERMNLDDMGAGKKSKWQWLWPVQ